MVARISGVNVPQAYSEGLWVLQSYANVEMLSRNGPVKTIPCPTVLRIDRPWERVLFHPVRDANPFFHVMEFCWMLAGSNDAEWISMFNKQMMEYADEGILRGAYGWRWARDDQIGQTIGLLRNDPYSRQAVVQMWDYTLDGSRAQSSDRPCNTHIYFRVNELDELEMTVCNRSNDFFWGMLGSNVVHFTMLHEIIAHAIGRKMGAYYVFTNNLHVYTDMPGFEEKFRNRTVHDWYKYDEVRTQPLLEKDETWEMLRDDCKVLVEGGGLLPKDFNTEWMMSVGLPIHDAYLDKHNRTHLIESIGAPDWHRACSEWNKRRL